MLKDNNAVTCHGKKIYHSYAAADKANKKYTRVIKSTPRLRNFKQVERGLHAYRCNNCRLYHIGHASGNSKWR